MDKLKEIYEYLYDKFYKLTSKFDGVNEFIFEKTGIKINVGIIVFGIAFVLMLIFFVKVILGFVLKFLFHGTY